MTYVVLMFTTLVAMLMATMAPEAVATAVAILVAILAATRAATLAVLLISHVVIAGAYTAAISLATTINGVVNASHVPCSVVAAVGYLVNTKYNVAAMFHNTTAKSAAAMSQSTIA